jgi:hypothetical protein
MVDVSVDWEKYDGFWNQDGEFTPDPPKSDLNQYRLNLGYVHRLASRWQAGVLVPYVWNNNAYSGASSRSDGLGDSTLNLWYEAVDEKSVWLYQNRFRSMDRMGLSRFPRSYHPCQDGRFYLPPSQFCPSKYHKLPDLLHIR